MKKITILAIALLGTSLSHASTQGFFSNPESATVIIQGRADDLDAIHLFNSMTVAPTEDQGAFVKNLAFTTSAQIKILDLNCKISKTVQNLGSCTLTLHRSPFTALGTSYVLLHLNQSIDSNELAKQFGATDVFGKILSTSNDKLTIRFDRDGSEFGWFSITYYE